MKNLRFGAALLFLVIGCGEEGGSQVSLNPPQNIDAVSCYDITMPEFTISTQCSACCTQQGFPGATQYDGHCVCGDRRDDAGDTVCAAQTASSNACGDCCTGAGFTGRTFSSSSSGPSTCACHGRSDTAVCASSLTGSEPSKACRTCCLNNGYLGSGYTNFDTPECQCSEF